MSLSGESNLRCPVFIIRVPLQTPKYSSPEKHITAGPHRGLLPLPVCTAGWGLCRDSLLTVRKWQCLPQGFTACPGSGTGATGHGGEETALLPRQVQAGRGQGEQGKNHRFVLHPWLPHGWKCQTQKCRHRAWHFRHTSLWETLISCTLSLQSWVPLSKKVCGHNLGHIWHITSCLPWVGWSCLGTMSLPMPHPSPCLHLLPSAVGPHCHLTLPDTHPKPDGAFCSPGSHWSSFGRLPQLRSRVCGHGQQSLPKAHMWELDSCWSQLSITVQLVQLPQSIRFLAGKRWFLELETFSCENGSFDKGLSFCDRDNQNENLILNQNVKKLKTETVTLSVLTFPIQNFSESFPRCVKMFLFWFFFLFVSLGKKNLEMLTFPARDISSFI